jgi:hypothetical protein
MIGSSNSKPINKYPGKVVYVNTIEIDDEPYNNGYSSCDENFTHDEQMYCDPDQANLIE